MDKIVSTTYYRDYVLIFTERGCIFKLLHDDLTNQVVVHKIASIYEALRYS